MLSVSSLALVLATGGAAAQSLSPPYDSYAAKFSCNATTTDADVVIGTYATSVNIHNPQSQLAVKFFKKIVTAPEEAPPGQTQPPGTIVVLSGSSTSNLDVLPPDQAERVDCPVINRVLFPQGTAPSHVEGFVVIQVQKQSLAGMTPIYPALDVVGKYTARAGASGFDVVVYSPKLITQ
jgi:hypothetical protein